MAWAVVRLLARAGVDPVDLKLEAAVDAICDDDAEFDCLVGIKGRSIKRLTEYRGAQLVV